MKALYPAAWLMIILFLGWSGNLLLNIQAIWTEASNLHKLSSNFDTLVQTWRDLNRPGNDVLENYEVAKQRAAFDVYAENFEIARDAIWEKTRGNRTLLPLLEALERERATVTGLAQDIFNLTDQRESLRLSRAPEESIRQKETEAAKRMAVMDQTFQNGLDYILSSNDAVIEHEQDLEALQRDNFKRLYMMLLVALIASALSVQLLRRTMRQREALSDSATRINTIMDNVIDGIVTVDDNGRIESITPPAERMFRCGTDELLGQDFSMLLDEGCQYVYHDRLSSRAEPVISSFDSSECEMCGLRPDGTTFPIELAVTRVVVHGRELLIHLVRDITERKRADERQRLAASVFENTSEGIVVTDVEGMIQFVNPAFTAITQYEAKEVIGKNPRILNSGKHDRQFYESMWRSILEVGHWQGEIWNRRKNGEVFPQWLTIGAIKDNWGNTTNYVGVTWDISERKRAEEEAKHHQEELAHVMRLSTMGEMASGMAHELNQPLAAVASYCETARKMVEEQPNMPEKLSDILGRAMEQTHRAGDIIRRLRNFVSKGTTQKEPVDIDKLIRDSMDFLEWELRNSHVKIDFNHCGQDCKVMVDKVQIEQVLLNLVRNSLEAIQNAGIREGYVLLNTHTLPGNLVEVTVSDNGPGIDEEMIDQLFNPFQTNKGTGMGMGLSISRSIVEAHGGKLWAAKAPASGAVFSFKLPLADA
ncbi:MAG: PAS domain S-box protein [Pseudomonadota bacterium]|nr:PAS domain S-box protein [Pseudomonadota bacterium]